MTDEDPSGDETDEDRPDERPPDPGPPHPTMSAYHLWSGGEDSYDAETIAQLEQYHGAGTNIWPCYNCGEGVHFGNTGWNEQTAGYVRFGPLFLCGQCLQEAFDLPPVPGTWPHDPVPERKDD